ncbi:phage recombination protein Bet [Metabacillus bambusae]|uniref:Phage recombination protein Bet n=1 Tax=Metabacillus bambusae TaxID=2795218 RepID=A0ABS3NBS6_9BACI|nr:phage recombination protein Bet [Metabacillus bambusae]MBO1515688.1 phage recombination protein Bet [Metabacillus bambusae]
MSNDLMTKSVEFEVNGEPVKLSGSTVKNYLVRGNDTVSEQEIVMFINLCKYQKLNPFLNEAYLVKFKGAPAQIITSKEAFMKRAEANENFEGLEAGIIVEREGKMIDIEGAIKLKSDTLIGGWAKVFRTDRKAPITVRISVDEFSKGQATWKQMPLNMIRKTAIVNAMREAFPGNLGNMYTEEEQQSNSNFSSPEEEVKQEVKENANSEIIDVEFTEMQDEQPQFQQKQSAMDLEGPPF